MNKMNKAPVTLKFWFHSKATFFFTTH